MNTPVTPTCHGEALRRRKHSENSFTLRRKGAEIF
jgi:hypothetical protein